ncbi:MAG: M20/M25/M40 family metallo-hydrolase, partial [Vicinamibacterales bacterium]
MRRALLVMLLAASAATFVTAQNDRLDYSMLGRIRDEGLNRSQVMDHVSWLSDVYGPRLTGSPGIQQASEWTMKKFREWGLANVHQERWAFGKGWSLVRFSAHLIEPQIQPLVGFPQEWSSGTRGPVTAEVVRIQIANEADFARYQGKLAGKIVLPQPARRVRMLEGPIILRMTDKDIAEAETTPVPAAAAAGGGRGSQAAFRQKVSDFYAREGVVAVFDRGSDSDMAAGGSDLSWQQQHPDGGTIFPSGASPRDDKAGQGVPVIALAVEHYNRMVRVLDKGVPVKVELNVETRFYDETTPNGFNTLADIPGTDLASEIVLLGAHFDSHPYATGATDNATGSAAMMEAMRILTAVGAKPRRTIRIGLWGGEEQGLLGSRAYVRDHIADVDTMALKPEHARLSAVFNSDNGSGRIRGIWLQSNLAVRPIFEAWMAPLHDLGVTTIGPRSVVSTDHVSFDNAGIPAFQFMV